MSSIENSGNVQKPLLVVEPPRWQVWLIWVAIIVALGAIFGPERYFASGSSELPTPSSLRLARLVFLGFGVFGCVVLFVLKKYTFFPDSFVVDSFVFRYRVGAHRLKPPFVTNPKPDPWWYEYLPIGRTPMITVWTETATLKIPLEYRNAYLLKDLYAAGTPSPPTAPLAKPPASKTP